MNKKNWGNLTRNCHNLTRNCNPSNPSLPEIPIEHAVALIFYLFSFQRLFRCIKWILLFCWWIVSILCIIVSIRISASIPSIPSYICLVLCLYLSFVSYEFELQEFSIFQKNMTREDSSSLHFFETNSMSDITSDDSCPDVENGFTHLIQSTSLLRPMTRNDHHPSADTEVTENSTEYAHALEEIKNIFF